jgi:hypothetical protein
MKAAAAIALTYRPAEQRVTSAPSASLVVTHSASFVLPPGLDGHDDIEGAIIGAGVAVVGGAGLLAGGVGGAVTFGGT